MLKSPMQVAADSFLVSADDTPTILPLFRDAGAGVTAIAYKFVYVAIVGTTSAVIAFGFHVPVTQILLADNGLLLLPASPLVLNIAGATHVVKNGGNIQVTPLDNF